jgi:hypothetical protein
LLKTVAWYLSAWATSTDLHEKNLVNTLRKEIERTGIPVQLMLRRASRKEKPPVSAATVYQWLNGGVKKANQDAMAYVLGLYDQ